MLNIQGNLFKRQCDAIAITTNGFVKRDGRCVMGKGCAKQAVRLLPILPQLVGAAIRDNGNKTQIVYEAAGKSLLIFPVKPVSETFHNPTQVVRHMQGRFTRGVAIPGWACVASLLIIEQSAHELVDIADEHGWSNVVIPRPGCGAGELSWDAVEPILQSILDDRFSAITF